MSAGFDYIRATTIDEAVALLGDDQIQSRVWCGGTDLMVTLRTTTPAFARAVDISQIPELHCIEMRGNRLHIGAAATFREVATHPLITTHAPLLAEATRSIGTMQIGNMATVGGNVANAAVAADSVPALVCLEADALIASQQGTRRLPVGDLITGPNRTALAANELITAFECDRVPADTRTRFLKVGRRNALSIARLSMAAMARQNADGCIAALRLVAGACFARPRRAHEVETLLLGQPQPPSADLFEAAGTLFARVMVEETGQRWSTAYKSVALAALVAEALECVIEQQEAIHAHS